MLRYSALLLTLALPMSSPRRVAEHAPLMPADTVTFGRWDLTLQGPNGPMPSWIEIRHSGNNAVVGQFVSVVGSARPISSITVGGDSLHFAIPPQWEPGNSDLVVSGHVSGEKMTGTITFPDGRAVPFTGVKAPMMKPSTPPWGAPIRLIHRNDLGGWKAMGATNQWEVKNGILRSPRSGVNLVTERKFGDFKLHVEFRYPKGSNSGVYLRGRHEVQIEDNYGLETAIDHLGSIYGFIAPSVNAARPAGEWQTYDITLVGRMVTVVANGKMIICNREIPGPTGGALDSNEGEPGPLYLQGDHGPIEYRNIILTPAR